MLAKRDVIYGHHFSKATVAGRTNAVSAVLYVNVAPCHPHSAIKQLNQSCTYNIKAIIGRGLNYVKYGKKAIAAMWST